jgi:hypothetical protein
MLEHRIERRIRIVGADRTRIGENRRAAGSATATDPGGSLAVRGGGLKLGAFGEPPAGCEGGGLKLGAPLPKVPLATVRTFALPGLAAPQSSSAMTRDGSRKGKEERRSRMGSR